VLVTGASGFVGRSTCAALHRAGFIVRQSIRNQNARHSEGQGFEAIVTGDLSPETSWDAALENVDCVVHLAARVHVMKEAAQDPEAEFDRLNCTVTRNLGQCAADRGVRRLILLSTIGVHGNFGELGENSSLRPYDGYTRSKVNAEKALREFEANRGLEVTILRPPLVYGPENPGNFLRLLQLASLPFPLPFGRATATRAMIYVENLADAIVTCVRNPKAASQNYLLNDQPNFSTAELIRTIRTGLGRRPFLLPLPLGVLSAVANTVGFGSEIQKLTAGLVVDSSKIRNELSWIPPVESSEGLARTVQWFRNTRSA
jgi:nucleoside-diphosphate-sugar epimerase